MDEITPTHEDLDLASHQIRPYQPGRPKVEERQPWLVNSLQILALLLQGEPQKPVEQ